METDDFSHCCAHAKVTVVFPAGLSNAKEREGTRLDDNPTPPQRRKKHCNYTERKTFC